MKVWRNLRFCNNKFTGGLHEDHLVTLQLVPVNGGEEDFVLCRGAESLYQVRVDIPVHQNLEQTGDRKRCSKMFHSKSFLIKPQSTSKQSRHQLRQRSEDTQRPATPTSSLRDSLEWQRWLLSAFTSSHILMKSFDWCLSGLKTLPVNNDCDKLSTQLLNLTAGRSGFVR